MTCIVAWITKDKMIMGSDTAALIGDRVFSIKHPKFILFKRRKNPDMLIGIAGRAKAHQTLMKLNGVIPEDRTKDPFIFVSQTISPIIQMVMSEERLTRSSEETDSEEEFQDSEMLIAYRGKLFYIASDFTVLEIAENFHSIGSGGDFAIASIKTAVDAGKSDPKEIIIQALKTAESFSCSVRGPFDIIEVPIEKPLTKKKEINKKTDKKPLKNKKEEKKKKKE